MKRSLTLDGLAVLTLAVFLVFLAPILVDLWNGLTQPVIEYIAEVL